MRKTNPQPVVRVGPFGFDRRFKTKELYDRYGEWIDHHGVPHLPALVWPDKIASIWCQYCEYVHTHSAEPGTRVAHCNPRLLDDGSLTPPSPYEETGYYLELVEIAVIHSHVRLRRLTSGRRPQSDEARPPIPPKERFRIFLKHGFRCIYCGRSPTDGIKLVLDHLEPHGDGGATSEENLAPACEECNQGKGKQTIL